MPIADVVFTGGAVFSAGAAASVAADVAVLDGRIVAVGPTDELHAWVGDATTVVDTSGRLVVAGFQDAHVHPIGAGVEMLQCDLTKATDAADCLRIIAEYAQANPDEPWIRGAGWSMEFFPGGTPTAAALDAVVADRPVLLSNRDHHGAWANSLALALAGLTAETPDPSDGRIERDAAGAPSGTLHEGAVALIETHAPDIDPELAYRGLLRAQEELLAQGVTGWQDAMVGEVLGLPDTLPVYLRAVADGTLTARVVAALWWERERDTSQLDEMVRRRDEVAALGVPERLRADSIKIMVDGVAENFTAAMNTPYRDAHGHPTSNSGHSFLTPQALDAAVLGADAAGFQVHFHALGNRAVREALDALEALPARAADAPQRRHHLAHLQIVDEVDVARFAELGAAANLQALWACHEPQLDELALPFLDAELEARHYPFGELDRAGVLLGAGSDWPVSTADPLAAIHVAVNRVGPGSDAAPLGDAGQRLDLATALTAYTAGSAWLNGRDGSTGRIEPGCLADLVVLDRDPFTGPATAIADTRVLSTWVDGALVHSAE
ncbi:amidohydrolase [Leifsonia sp. Leaf325]|nr:amidohydrolase [Leifsonia sp. Leaf325]KQQ92867.1 amidohydrolase [Leifsonia sp. Leaf325]